MNKVILKGNVGKDPDIRSFDWGKVAKFPLATEESYKNKEGERVTETTWHTIVFRGAVCDVIEKFIHKGDQLLVEGKISIRKYQDKNNVDRYSMEIICNGFDFCGGRQRKEEEQQEKEPISSNRAEDDPSYYPLPF